jgi:hypothetical protein
LVKAGQNSIVYTKPSIYSWYYYLIKFSDSLGNEYWYQINELYS